MALPYSPTLHYGNMTEQCKGMLQTVGAACLLEHFPCAPWCTTALWITAGCSLLHTQVFLLSPCSNDVYWVTHASALLHFSWPALQRQCSLLIRPHQNRQLLLLPTTADNYPPFPTTSPDNCHPLVTSHIFNWRAVYYLCSCSCSD